MSKKRKRISLAVWLALILASLAGVVLTGSSAQTESIQEIMRDAVLHESNKIDLFGMEVNPGLISAFTVTGLLLLAALLIRIFVIRNSNTYRENSNCCSNSSSAFSTALELPTVRTATAS